MGLVEDAKIDPFAAAMNHTLVVCLCLPRTKRELYSNSSVGKSVQWSKIDRFFDEDNDN